MKPQTPELETSQPRTYQTLSPAELHHQLTLEKPGTLASSQDILVTAQANGKVSKILAREGTQVKGGQPVIQLADTIASYKLQVERAKN